MVYHQHATVFNIEKGSTKRIRRKTGTLKKKLLSEQDNLLKYQEQQQISGPRSGYSKTDTDATAMKMKNEEILPAYNVLTGSFKPIFDCKIKVDQFLLFGQPLNEDNMAG